MDASTSHPDAGSSGIDAMPIGGMDATTGGGPDATIAAVLDLPSISNLPASAHEHEPTIAVSPTGHTVVGWLSYSSTTAGLYTVGYRISKDFGQSWGDAKLVPLPPHSNIQANASVAADDQGNLYIAWGSEEKTIVGVRSHAAIWAAKATPDALEFGAPVQVTDPNVGAEVYDSERISVTASGRVNIVYLHVSQDQTQSWIEDATSTDFSTWSISIVAGPGGPYSYRNFQHICRPEGAGRIYLTYLDSDLADFTNGWGLGLRYSDDDGKTWSSPVTVQTTSEDFSIPGYALDCVTHGDDVWVFYPLSLETFLIDEERVMPTLTSLRVAHSGDRGRTIDAHYDVGDANGLFMYPVIAVESGGALDLAYYEGKTDGDMAATLRWSRSIDGKTFPPSTEIHHPLTLETSRTTARWGGDYVGRATAGSDFYVVYADNAAAPHIDFYRTPISLFTPGTPITADPGAGRVAPPSCYADSAFTPNPWAPPAPFTHACTATQIQAYVTCSSSDCSTFRAAAANAGCTACLETDVHAPLHGPIITRTSTSGKIHTVDLNQGGCQAHYDNQSAAGSCGNQQNDDIDCVAAECSGCADYANPALYGPTYGCYYSALLNDGRCAASRVQTACGNETNPGGVAAICADMNMMLSAWCGP
jgi:hypothetical protein